MIFLRTSALVHERWGELSHVALCLREHHVGLAWWVQILGRKRVNLHLCIHYTYVYKFSSEKKSIYSTTQKIGGGGGETTPGPSETSPLLLINWSITLSWSVEPSIKVYIYHDFKSYNQRSNYLFWVNNISSWGLTFRKTVMVVEISMWEAI